MDGERARAAAEKAARESYGKLVAILAKRLRDVSLAEESLAEAFAAALATWPVRGVPDSPEAWLLTAARHQALDDLRRRKRHAAVEGHLLLMTDELASAGPRDILDDRLALMFACAHPAIDPALHAPLILQTVLGFDAATIASAFLVAPAAMGQRLVRAKQRIKGAGIPFRIPERGDMQPRLTGVLDAVYAAYTEGWSDPAGTDSHRRNLAGEAIWLGRLVASLMPDEPEALGLLALMLHAEARRAARRDAAGEFVPLAEQDTTLWSTDAIDEAEQLLRRAGVMAAPGRFQLEAAVQSAHNVRRHGGRADWPAILALYDALQALTASPVVAVNRAVALGETAGPHAALAALDAHANDAELSLYQPYWAARAEFLSRLGRVGEAGEAYLRAIGLESDPALRRFLQHKRGNLVAQR